MRMKKIPKLFLLHLTVFLIAFIINILWEYLHTPLYVTTMNHDLFGYMYMASVDGFLVLLIYWLVCLQARTFFWLTEIKNPNRSKLRGIYSMRDFLSLELGSTIAASCGVSDPVRAMKKHLVLIFLSGIFFSFFIEVKNVYFISVWSYTSLMPMIPLLHVGLSPIVQMLVTPILTFLLTKMIFSKLQKDSFL